MSTALTTLISVDTLAAEMSNPAFTVIDCRFSLADTTQGEAAFARARIPTAQYVHLDRDLSSKIVNGVTGRHPLPDAGELEVRFQQLGINNTSQIVVYDDKAGAIASRFWWLSRWLGHEACAVLDGGFAAWKKAEYALETHPPKAPLPGHFIRRDALIASIEKHDVLDQNNLLLDAREAERFAGEHEPIDPVAGHIPGAVNAPFAQNINVDGTFKSKEALRARFEMLLQNAESRRLVHYCGSGVTAAHNMLAMCVAGLPPGVMYAGSFSEWVSQNDEQYPVARLVD